MSSLLACRLSGRIAAVAPVAGVRAGNPAADDTNPYAGGGAAYWHYERHALRR